MRPSNSKPKRAGLGASRQARHGLRAGSDLEKAEEASEGEVSASGSDAITSRAERPRGRLLVLWLITDFHELGLLLRSQIVLYPH